MFLYIYVLRRDRIKKWQKSQKIPHTPRANLNLRSMCPEKVFCYLNQEHKLNPYNDHWFTSLVPMQSYLNKFLNLFSLLKWGRPSLWQFSKQLFLFGFVPYNDGSKCQHLNYQPFSTSDLVLKSRIYFGKILHCESNGVTYPCHPEWS